MLCVLLPTRHRVVLPPRPNDARERSSSNMAPSLNELDARLRALREQLGEDVSSRHGRLPRLLFSLLNAR